MSASGKNDPDERSQTAGASRGDIFCENSINLTLLDPPRFGWTAAGGVSDLLTPHERARRKSTKKAYIAAKRNKKRDRNEVFSGTEAGGVASIPAERPAARLKSVQEDCCESAIKGKSVDVAIKEGTTDTEVNLNGVSSSKPPQNFPSEIPAVSLKTANDCTDAVAGVTSNHDATEGPIRFKAVQDDGMLDITAYHQGREGIELRNEQTGDLLCNIKATDTNHNADEPKTLTATINIQFPLEDGDSDGGPRYYKETIQWDLTDSKTPNPSVYAVNIGEEFGLSYTQTSDLAESIQNQLYRFVHDNCAYALPVLLKASQQDKPAARVPHLYEGVMGFQHEAGTSHPAAQKPKVVLQKANSIASNRSVRTTSGSGKIPAKKRAPVDSRKAEEEFYQQVRTRLYEASVQDVNEKVQMAGDDDDGSVLDQSKELARCENHVCHICRQQQPVCWKFPCGTANHTYCSNHLSERLGLVHSDSQTSLKLDFCPICSLACNCQECAGKLDLAALEFRSRCHEQEATPESTEFESLFDRCKKINVNKQQKTTKPKRRRSSSFERRPVVLKLPLSEFPREVANGVDLDYEYEAEYRTVFNEEGVFLVTSEEQIGEGSHAGASTENVTPLSPSLFAPIEDGSVDFCNVCKKVGNLLCCDCCPRAFHSECLTSGESQQDNSETAKWECPCCRREKEGLLEDKVEGSTSMTAICAAFEGAVLDASSKDHIQGLKLLSILHDTLLRLMDYDFGYMFRAPVDCKQIPSYKTIVKKPMDLGTISSNMLNGTYSKLVGTEEGFLEDIALAVLKDVELVWHNCFIFNLEGSAVYRMAEVQKRRADAIRQRSFDHFLSEKTKQELTDYVASCETEREEYRRTVPPSRLPLTGTPQARHKIAGSIRGASHRRPIAILNPDTGRIVKIYATIVSAVNAVKVLLATKHDCEYDPKEINTKDKLKSVLKKCKDDARVRLYGYRWLYLHDLSSRQVSFVAPSTQETVVEESAPGAGEATAERSGLIQMVDGGLSYFFNSIDESLSFPGLPYNISEIRTRLLSLVPEADFSDIAGRMWRRFRPGTGRSMSETAVVPSQQNNSLGSNAGSTADDVTEIADVVVIKEDLIAGKRGLLGFDSKDAAYQDWLQTLDSSVFPYEGPRSMEIFLEFYLDGDRNVDGIRWKTAENPDSDAVSSGDRVADASNYVAVMEVFSEGSQQKQAGEPDSKESVAAKERISSENMRFSKVYDVESIPSPKPAREKSTLVNGNASLEKLQVPPASHEGENGERAVMGDSSVYASTNKDTTAVG